MWLRGGVSRCTRTKTRHFCCKFINTVQIIPRVVESPASHCSSIPGRSRTALIMAAAMAPPAPTKEVQWSTHQGKSTYTATGSRDVLFILSETLPSTAHANVTSKAVPKRENPLGVTEEEACKLESHGIERQSMRSDLDLMVARHKLDKRHRVIGVLEGWGCEQIKREIGNLMSNTDREGVTLCYIGHGKRESGDWCFNDGFVTFQDIIKLYKTNFQEKVLSIITDCSYSGHWVKNCMDFMDNEAISPCGHFARENGILIKVFASCQSSEIPVKMAFSVHGANNEKNTGLLSFSAHFKGASICSKQHSSGIDFTQITCKRSLDKQCVLASGYSWAKWQEARRVQLVTTTEQGQPKWYYILLSSSDDKQAEFTQKLSTEQCSVKISDYGRVLMKGIGPRPNNEVKDMIERKFLPIYV